MENVLYKCVIIIIVHQLSHTIHLWCYSNEMKFTLRKEFFFWQIINISGNTGIGLSLADVVNVHLNFNGSHCGKLFQVDSFL